MKIANTQFVLNAIRMQLNVRCASSPLKIILYQPPSHRQKFKILYRISSQASAGRGTSIQWPCTDTHFYHIPDSIYSVVFSCWTKMLDLVEVALKSNGIGFTRMEGSLTTRERKEHLHTFRNDPNCRVFLSTLGSGSTG